MKQSELFTKTLREAPKDEQAVNAQFLNRAGFVHKVMAGVYEYLPLGYSVLQKINQIIREEMNAIGGQELHMSILQNKETWAATGRWTSAADVMYQFEDASGKQMGLGWTHEEPLTVIAKHYISSYKDLPKAVYQIQTKFRNEPRAKSGVLRGREFLMKDLYSFHASQEDLDRFYEKAAVAYANVFKRVGLDARRTLASGGLFSKFSDEFQVLSESGEDTIFYCEACDYTANKEVAGELNLADKCPKCSGKLTQGRAIEVGNIFKLGTKFSEALGLSFTDKDGSKKPVIMASYGIGPSRLLGTIVETSHDEKGIIWPKSVSPFDLHLINIAGDEKAADKLYETLQSVGFSVLYDQRDARAGEKFADADLIGIPKRILVSDKTLKDDSVEIKDRNTDKTSIVKVKDLTKSLKTKI
ncbi:MAG TPA: aminoacyl--tRNA ligase-related protein [Patescibacteria group bacterium]